MLMEGKPENSEGTLTVEALTKLGVWQCVSGRESKREPGVTVTERMKEELEKDRSSCPLFT